MSFVFKKIAYNKNKRILHSGSALAFQARGAGSIPAIRSKKRKLASPKLMAGVAKW